MHEEFSFKPLTTGTWKPFESLFGSKGACGGCWCMTWRLTKREYDLSKGDANRQKIKQLVDNREPVGVIAFHQSHPVGWCAVAPRNNYARLEKSRALKPLDDKPVWSVSCFFIAKPYRKKGLSVKLLRAAVDYAGAHGAEIIEGYPIQPKDKSMPDVFAWTGILSSYLKAGFREEKRHSPSRPIVRIYLKATT
jgi:GNAT superfamily N-acetyltransferase